MFDSTLNRVTLCVRFTVEFPLSPPEVWLRRPRMRYRTGTGGWGLGESWVGREKFCLAFGILKSGTGAGLGVGWYMVTKKLPKLDQCVVKICCCRQSLPFGRGPQMGKFAFSLQSSTLNKPHVRRPMMKVCGDHLGAISWTLQESCWKPLDQGTIARKETVINQLHYAQPINARWDQCESENRP